MHWRKPRTKVDDYLEGFNHGALSVVFAEIVVTCMVRMMYWLVHG